MCSCLYQAGLNLPMWLKTQTKLFDNRNLISANAQPSVRMNGCVRLGVQLGVCLYVCHVYLPFVYCVCVHIKISLNVATAAGAIVCVCREFSLLVVAVDSCLQAVGTTLTQQKNTATLTYTRTHTSLVVA